MRRSLVVVLLVGLCTSASLAQDRHVVVVMDDSGSMAGEGAMQANYALQTLAGLLRPQDRLSVVPLSAPTTEHVYSLHDRAEAIRLVAGRYETDGGTPYRAVMTAMDLLRGVDQSSAIPPELWLVVLTDGDFDGAPQDHGPEIQSLVAETGVRAIFLLIGGVRPDVAQLWAREGQASVYRAVNARDVVDQMGRIAGEITARSPSPLGVSVVGDSLALTSTLPLRRLTLLEQREEGGPLAHVVGARGRRPLEAEGPFAPAAPGGRLVGHVSHISGPGDGRIAPGPIVVRFNRPPAGALAVFPEAAVRLRVRLVDGAGETLPLPRAGPVRVCPSDSVALVAEVLDPDGVAIAPPGLAVTLRDDTARVPMTAHGPRFRRSLTLTTPRRPVSVEAALPGYFRMRTRSFVLDVAPCAARLIDLVSPNPWRAPVTQVEATPPIRIHPQVDGRDVPPDVLASWRLHVTIPEGLRADVDVEGGDVVVRPRQRFGTDWLACCTRPGRFEVEVELRSRRPGEGPLIARPIVEVLDVGWLRHYGPCLLAVLGVLLLLTYVIGVVKRRRFPKGAEIAIMEGSVVQTRYPRKSRKRTEPLSRGFIHRWVVPFGAENVTVREVTFVAGRSPSHVFVPESQVTEQMIYAGETPDLPARRPLKVDVREPLQVLLPGGRRTTYTYRIP